MWRALVLAWLLGATAAGEEPIVIGVVEQSLELENQLAAAVEAALRAAAGAEAPGAEAPGSARAAAVEPGEALALPAHVCAQAAQGAVAVVGGGAGGAAALSAAGAARAGMPLLLAQPAPAALVSWEALALYPQDHVLAEACAVLCREKSWRRAVLLHEPGQGARGAALIAPDGAALNAPDDADAPLELVARQLPRDGDDALLRNLLLVLKNAGATKFIVWCDAACAVRVLDVAQRVGLLDERYEYVVLTLELHTQNLHDYSHGGANITGLMLFDPESDRVRAAMAAWREAYAERLGDSLNEEEAAQLQAAPPSALLLAYDAAAMVADALARLQLPSAAGAPVGCESGAGAFHADTLLNFLRSEEWDGVSGALAWGADGARRAVRLHVAELERGGRLQLVGSWAPRSGVAWHREPLPAPPLPSDSMANRHFNVLIAMNNPYVMARQSTTRLSGNERYEGFCIELIEHLGEILNFNYTFILQEDGQYGSFNATTREWNGMLRRIMEDENAHFAITDLTITAEREQAVDFTTPFMNLGISILFRTPKAPEPELFAFLLPFSKGVWLCLGFAYLGTSLVLYVVGRLCPEEWQNPYPCIDDPPALENQFTLANALWFNLGAVLLQGSEIAPVAYGTRAVASAWWLFALVITSSYTANLATLLARKSSNEIIQNVKDLAENEHGISYGAKAGGATYTFFEHSQAESEIFQKMYLHMKEQTMPTTNEQGVQKVKESDYKYAFLMESTSIEYTIERDCAVTKVGELLDSKGYGIAMVKNSPYRQALNLALLKLQESGVLREMKYTWWKEKHGGGACKPVEEYENVRLSMTNFLGLFIVLVVGCVIGVAVSCCDLAWSAWRRPRDPAEPFTRRFWDELRFVFRFEQSVKPLEGSLSESTSGSAQSETSRDGSEAGAEGTGSAEETGSGSGSGGTPPAAPAPPPPPPAAMRARRRSSMHAASVRLARHARESSTPARSGR